MLVSSLIRPTSLLPQGNIVTHAVGSPRTNYTRTSLYYTLGHQTYLESVQAPFVLNAFELVLSSLLSVVQSAIIGPFSPGPLNLIPYHIGEYIPPGFLSSVQFGFAGYLATTKCLVPRSSLFFPSFPASLVLITLLYIDFSPLYNDLACLPNLLVYQGLLESVLECYYSTV